MVWVSSRLFRSALGVLALLAATAALAQTQIPFAGLSHDSSEPIEVTSDTLSIDQSSGKAVFDGSVVVGQGNLRISATHVNVQYVVQDGRMTSDIERIIADGDVVMVLGEEAAEADHAEYDPAAGTARLSGNVTLTQGPSVMMGQQLDIDFNSGAGVMSGRVTTILRSGNN